MIRTLFYLMMPLVVFLMVAIPAQSAANHADNPACADHPLCSPGLSGRCLSGEGAPWAAEDCSTAPSVGGDSLRSVPLSLTPPTRPLATLTATSIEPTSPLSATDFAYLPYISKPPTPLGWVPIGPVEGEALLDMDVAPNDSYRLYASTREGVYRSLDGGIRWELALGGFFRQLVIDPQQPNILYTGPHDDSFRYGIYKSTDGGDQWAYYNEGMTCEDLYGLSIAATDPNILFTGSF